MNNKCEYCEIVERESQIIATSEQAVVAVKDKVLIPGQITIFPKEHFTIMEMVPETILQQCILLANKVSAAVFESLGSQGTNIVIKNGLGAGQDVPHFCIEVIPRKEGDGLNLQWEPQSLPEEEIEMVAATLIEAIELAKKGSSKESISAGKMIKEEKGKKDYLIRSLRRIP